MTAREGKSGYITYIFHKLDVLTFNSRILTKKN